jgi:hypothetical protein
VVARLGHVGMDIARLGMDTSMDHCVARVAVKTINWANTWANITYNTEVRLVPTRISRDEVIPFPRTSDELGRQNQLAASKSYVFSHLRFQTL